jgi:hypothetical protein
MEHRGVMNNLKSGLEFLGFIVFAIVLLEMIIPDICHGWDAYLNKEDKTGKPKK